MALVTWLDITVEDAQGYQGTISYRIKPLAYGATTMPTQAKIQAVADALFGDDKLSDCQLVSWQVRAIDESVAGGGGLGNTPTSEALRMRSSTNSIEEFLTRLPGVNKANQIFDPQNPASVSVSTGLFTALRDALTDSEIAVSSPVGAYAALDAAFIAQNASVVDGRRAPLRPR